MTAIVDRPVGVAGDDADRVDVEFPNGDDLALSRGTDFCGLDELLGDHEREIRDRVRVWCDTRVAPAAAGFWQRAEFPVELAKEYGRLGIAGASIVGDGCPGLTFPPAITPTSKPSTPTKAPTRSSPSSSDAPSPDSTPSGDVMIRKPSGETGRRGERAVVSG